MTKIILANGHGRFWRCFCLDRNRYFLQREYYAIVICFEAADEQALLHECMSERFDGQVEIIQADGGVELKSARNRQNTYQPKLPN